MHRPPRRGVDAGFHVGQSAHQYRHAVGSRKRGALNRRHGRCGNHPGMGTQIRTARTGSVYAGEKYSVPRFGDTLEHKSEFALLLESLRAFRAAATATHRS